MDALEPLGRALAEAVGSLSVKPVGFAELIEDAETDAEIRSYLLQQIRDRSLAPTATVERDRNSAEVALMAAEMGWTRPARLTALRSHLRQLDEDLVLARWRDSLLTPECAPWCNGRGCRATRGPEIDGEAFAPSGASTPEILRARQFEYCGCPAGQERKLADEQRLAAQEAAVVQRRIERFWTASRLEGKLRTYSLESYLAHPKCKPALVEVLRRWQQTRCWLLLWGPPGLGKTGLSISLVREALDAGRSAMYITVPDFLERLRESYRKPVDEDGNRPADADLLEVACKVDLLLLDDVGKASLSAWGKEKLFTLLNRRDINGLQTIVTTNLTLAQLELHLESPSFDRIRGNAEPEGSESFVIEMTGESLRGVGT